MKNLKTIRKHNSTEEGFSLVTAAGFGLVIMMIGLTIMSRSMKDNTVSASQKINNRSLAAAESGISTYLSLLNKKSGIALPKKNSNDWATSGLSADEIAKTQGWQDIVAGNPDKGQYKLLSYTPTGTDKAILKVQGRVNQTGTGSGATEDISTGMTTVEAIIGVTEGAAPGSDRGTPTQITADPATAAAAAVAGSTTATTASNAAVNAVSLPNVLTASTANNDADKLNIIASGANTITTPSSAATIAAASATKSARNATNSAASAVDDAQTAANATGATTTGTAAVTATTAAANATVAAAAANTAAAAANTAASTGNTNAATAAAATAAAEATKAATAAETANNAAAPSSSGSGTPSPTSSPSPSPTSSPSPSPTSSPSPSPTATGATRFPGLWLIDGPNNTTSTNFNQSYNAYGLVTNTPATSLWTSPGLSLKDPQIEVPNSVSRTPPPFAMSKCLLANPISLPNPIPSSFLNSVDLATRIPKNGNVTFPTDSDRAGTDGIYRYYASNLNLEGNTTVRFKAAAKVIVHLQGDMITKGNIDIKPCDGADTCKLNNLVIYGYKPNGQLLIQGTNTVGAFIIAPTYSAGVAGGGNGEGYKGALWAGNWTGASNSNKFVVNQDGNKDQDLACPYNNPSIQVISQAVVPNS